MANLPNRPTIRPAVAFDPSTDAATLKKAMKGMGTDEKLIIQVLGRRTSHQRQQILHNYKQLYGKDLIKELKNELSGTFEDIILAIMTPLPTYLAQELNKATKGFGTNEKTLIEILCTSDNKSLKEIKAAYQNLYGKTLEENVKDDTSGDFSKLLISLASTGRNEATVDRSMAHGLAQSLYKVGEKKRFGTDEAEFNRIVTSYSFPLLRLVFEEYEKITGNPFEHAINAELSSDYKDGIMAIYSFTINKAAFFAKSLHDAMKCVGTRNDALIRIIISRCEIDMGNIKEEYNKAYGKKLEEAITSETSGDFKKLLLALIQE